MVERRFVLDIAPSLSRNLGSLERRDVSREEAGEDGAGERVASGATGR